MYDIKIRQVTAQSSVLSGEIIIKERRMKEND